MNSYDNIRAQTIRDSFGRNDTHSKFKIHRESKIDCISYICFSCIFCASCVDYIFRPKNKYDDEEDEDIV